MNNKLNKYLNIVLIFLTIIFIFMLATNKRSTYNSKKIKNISLLKEIEEKNKKIEELNKYKNNINIKLKNKNKEIEYIKNELNKKIMSSNEFKKILYYLSEKSGLYLINISKEQVIESFYNFKLCYASIEFKGSLISLGRFLYFINKIDEYFDNSRFNMKLMEDRFILNLGYIRSDIE